MTQECFYEKVRACWLGKNIGGTLGGPLEGRMELLDIKGYTQSFVEPEENDDLDLQLVNLHCVEQYGGNVNCSLLSREWLEHVHFEYDEYGHSLTNMRRGFGAPLSGWYNNFFTDCMGAPIRSEIWAVICADMPDLAAFYAYHDASVDHAGGEGMYGEIFFAVLESMAFEDQDKMKLIHSALNYIPKDCAVFQAVELLLKCFNDGKGWIEARQAIIDRFAGDNFTYAPVNIAFTLIGWLYEDGFTKQMLMTLDCGYDTDCTVATLGSLLGILYGPEYIESYWTDPLGQRIITSKPITGFDAPKTICELTERSIAARNLVQAQLKNQKDRDAFRIPYQHDVEVYTLPYNAVRDPELLITVKRCPAFTAGETKSIQISLKNNKYIAQEYRLYTEIEGFTNSSEYVKLEAGASSTILLQVTAPKHHISLVHGRLRVEWYLNGVYWKSECIPLNVMGTMDWQYKTETGSGILHLTENRITGDMLPKGSKTLLLETTLGLSAEGSAVLKLACTNPLRAALDGNEIINCPDRTAMIPAYHRADPRKCAALPDQAGEWKVQIVIEDAEHFDEICFMVVTQDLYWAYRLDSTFTVDTTYDAE